jgi:cytoskeleton protein RodZ
MLLGGRDIPPRRKTGSWAHGPQTTSRPGSGSACLHSYVGASITQRRYLLNRCPRKVNLTFEGSTGIVVCVTEENGRPLGEWLRQRREELGISLEQAEADTRIRIRYIDALETGNFDSLPDPVVGRGFLRNYASYLELDVKEASDRYSGLVAPPEPEPLPDRDAPATGLEPFRPVSLHDMPGFRATRNWFVVAALILGVALVAAAWWGYPYISSLVFRERSDPKPPATQQLTNTDLPTATLTASAAAASTSTVPPTATGATPVEATATLELSPTPSLTPSPSPSPSPPVYTGIFLEVVFTNTSWIQVTVDGVRLFQGELEADTYRSWYGEERIELRIGSAGAVLVTVNGESLGPLGAPGEVVDRVFEKVDEEVTQATVTPSSTVQETPTQTATTTPTLEPSPAPTTAEPSPSETGTAAPTDAATASP